MANLTIQHVTTNGGARYDDYTVFINENIGTNTLVGKIVGWEGTPNVSFRFHEEGGVKQNLNDRYKILQVDGEYYLAVDQGGPENFDYEDETEVGNFHQQIWIEAVTNTTPPVLVHTGVYDVILNNIEPEGTPNTPPVVGGFSGSFMVDDNATNPVSPFGNVTITDSDSASVTVTITFDASKGTLSNLGGGSVSGNTYTFTGTAGQVQAAIRGLQYNPADRPNDQVGAQDVTTFSLSVTDGGTPVTSPTNVTVTSTVANRAPDVAATAVNHQIAETATVAAFGGVSITDTNANDTITVTITLDNNAKGTFTNYAALGFTFAGGVYSYTGTAANAQAAIRALLFDPQDRTGPTSAETTTFTVTVRDAGGATDSINNIQVTATHTNTAPNLSVAAGETSIPATDTGGPVEAFRGITIAESNSDDILTLTISFRNEDGFLGIPTINGVAVDDNGTNGAGNRTFTFSGTVANLNTFLDQLTFDPTDRTSSGPAVTTQFSFTLTDSFHPISNYNNAIEVVTEVVGSNTAPVINGAATPVTKTTSDRANIQAFLDIVIQDAGVLEVIVRMDSAQKGRFVGDGGIYNPDNGTFTISGTAQQVTAALQALRFDARDKAAGSVAEVTTFTITVTDGATPPLSTSNSNISVSAAAPDAPPTNRAPTNITLSNVTIQELSKTGAEIATLSATDADGDSLSYKIQLANGALVDSDGYFAVSGNKLVVANGVLFDAEQALTRPITLQVSDGLGGTATQTFTINISDKSPEIMTAADASPFNDIIKGSRTGNFKDVFFGGAGDDKLWGGYGNDTLWGNAGKDIFVFDGKLGTASTDRKVNFDTIKDYSVKDDALWLDNDLFKSNKKLYASIKKGTETKPLKMASKFFTVGDKAKDADDHFVYDARKRVLYYDADGNGSKAAIELATFTNNKALKGFGYKELFFI